MDSTKLIELAELINSAKVGVIPTDTIYGVVASIRWVGATEAVHVAKGRPAHKPFPILISNHDQLEELDIELDYEMRETLGGLWPGPNTVVLPSSAPEYLQRGLWSLAVRMPDLAWLRDLIDRTGPLIATSANPAGVQPVQDIEWIKKHFPDLDFYIEGKTRQEPSQLYIYDNGVVVAVER